MEFEQVGGLFQVAPLTFATFSLDGAELFESLLELAGEAVAVQTEGGQEAMGVDDVELDGGLLVGWIHGASEEVSFEERDAVLAPGSVRKLVDELRLGRGGGPVLIEKLMDVAFEGGRVFGRQDGGAASQTVLERVERRTLFAGCGARAGGMLRVRAIESGATGLSGCG